MISAASPNSEKSASAYTEHPRSLIALLYETKHNKLEPHGG
jgi:hypothetical protein